ncbi:hypothetical protein SteCoe_16395 [Stentor coeruleus]|uniref:Uncharacterized protein n=1 Tax=Stentor coeruleus TaxID=5963 RepID=A0A1R2C195_9CILI|nr:hypothetical protein SteCoe_16395 [Stentor coeruleus]
MSHRVNISCQVDFHDMPDALDLVSSLGKSFEYDKIPSPKRSKGKNQSQDQEKYLSAKRKSLQFEQVMPLSQLGEYSSFRKINRNSAFSKLKKKTQSKRIKERNFALPKIDKRRSPGNNLHRSKVGNLLPLQGIDPMIWDKRKYSYFLINYHSIYEDFERF